MFSVKRIETLNGTIEYRRDRVTGLSCRINAERIKRGIDRIPSFPNSSQDCPFCPDLVEKVTPVFPDGTRIVRGESVTFPNLFPFGEWHTVTVITKKHSVDGFTSLQIEDALKAQVESLGMRKGYASINWNFLPSAGASLAHPHLQGLVDAHPPYRVRCTLEGGKKLYQRKRIRYWDELERKEKTSDRYLFGDEIRWLANPVPIGEKEVLGILPCSTLEEFRPLIPEFVRGVLTLIHLYRAMGTHAFNMSVFFANEKKDHNFRAFCSMIARINPNPSSLSDSSFMERLHLEPLILTSPEDLGRFFHREKATLAKYPKALFTG